MEPLYCKYCGQLLTEKEGNTFNVMTGSRELQKFCQNINCQVYLTLNKRIYRRIKKAGPEGITRSLLYSQSHLSAEELNNCTLELISSGKIKRGYKKNITGVEAIVYLAV